MNVKEKILNYLLDNYKITPKNEFEIFSTVEETENELELLINYAFTDGEINGFEKSKNGYLIVYGSDLDRTNGFIIVLNKDLKPIALTSNYENGQSLGRVELLKVAEDGSIYAIIDTWNTNEKNLVMLNNFTLDIIEPNSDDYLNDYYRLKVKLKKSYKVKTNLAKADLFDMLKDPNSANYIFHGRVDRQPIVTTLKINVGSENEWVEYRCNSNIDYYVGNDFYAIWQNEEVNFKIIGNNIISNIFHYVEFTNGDNNTLIKKQIDYTYANYHNSLKSKIIDYDNVYIAFCGSNTNIVFNLYKVNYSTNSLDIIFNKTQKFYQNQNGRMNYFDLVKINSQIFYSLFIANDPIDENYTYKWIIGRIEEDKTKIKDFIVSDNIELSEMLKIHDLFINNQYNLYNFYAQTDKKLYKFYSIYNDFNFNGEEYQDYNSLKSEYANLYSNNKVIFSRNLYNKNISENQTTSIVEIPNYLLNNINIDKETLMSETNFEISTLNTKFNKNIYETVYLNFNNILSIIDDNNNLNKFNRDASIRFNNSVSNILDYNETKLSKIRINYDDDTQKNIEIKNNELVKIEINNNIANITFLFYVDKKTKSIDFISNDEKTNYLSINTSNFKINTIYKIKQKVEVI